MISSWPTVTAFFVTPHLNSVRIDTSDRGRIFSVRNDGTETHAMQADASQISAIFSQGNNLYAASSNQGRLFRIGPDAVAEGVYESAVLDARTTAAWGNAWWAST